jgi:predicted metal-dependent hydrolase
MNARNLDLPDARAAELDGICRSVLRATSPLFSDAAIAGAFYPYIGLSHTIRRRGSDWTLRISDHCRNAPRQVLEAIVTMLACKIVRRRPPLAMIEVYNRFRDNPLVEAAVQARRRNRGRKQIRSADGHHHSLVEIYHHLNATHFNCQIEIRQIGWGVRRSWSRMGHYDPAHHTITISPVLDSSLVPREIVAYIVYHEMLHALFNDTSAAGRRRHHPPEYRRVEESYPGYREAKEFLARFCRHRGKIGQGKGEHAKFPIQVSISKGMPRA